MVLNRFVCGCLPLTPKQHRAQEAAAAGAVSLPDYTWRDHGEMPVIKWDGAFEARLSARIVLASAYEDAGLGLWPWEIFRALPPDARRSDILSWDQGAIPSCSMHAAAHAYQCATLYAIALGAPLYYEAVNPIYPFYGARGGNLAGGLDLWTAADWINKKGFLPASLAGEDNRSVSRENLERMDQGKNWQGAIVLIEDDFAERIFRACRALCAVSFGSGRLYTSARTDANGVKVMDGLSYGGHAQAFAGWRRTGGKEYVFNWNSHGNIYGQTGEGEPASGAWVSMEQMRVYCRDMENYGLPYIVFPEGDFRRGASLTNDFDLPKRKGGNNA